MNSQWMSVLNDCNTAVELGCGFGVVLKKLVARGLVTHGVDIFAPYLDYIPVVAPGATYEEADALAWCERQPDNSWDAILSIDSIEHMAHDIGEQVIAHAQRIARVGIVLETPLGYIEQGAEEGLIVGTPGVPSGMLNPYQAHACGWTVAELTELGFTCKVKPAGAHPTDRICATWRR